ncbi:hypothetical protein IEO21_04213 [Rhodonia placenta]|uniref:AB hydrolase-1 domain-containing protein n=1 Tax=Rhodonia placenta TaxID=104341 RepID=A0A8H7P4A7_9APHY|nr:hypothetical protein IEO21_04213 [Postia placenta]
MPVGPVDDQGTVLYLEHSGVPESASDYVTLILVHGAMKWAGAFRRMLPFASTNNLRLVLVNKHDYRGSTPYSQEELKDLASPDRGVQARAIAARGLEIGTFIRWFIQAEHIPPISASPRADDSRGGGVSLLGWSAGNLRAISFLAHVQDLPKETRSFLESYFRSLIVFDSSQTVLGIPPLPATFSALNEASLTPEQKVAAFPIWVSTYFTPAVVMPEDDSESPGLIH